MNSKKVSINTISFLLFGTVPIYAQQYNPYILVCKLCPAGTKGDGTTKSCTPCEKGKFSVEGSSECSLCAAGSSTNNQTGQGACTPCAAGTYTSSKGQATCTSCSTGTCAVGKGNTSCKSCTGSGVTTCDKVDCHPLTCSEGYGLSNNLCTACGVGKYSTNGDNSCYTCPAGTKNPNNADSKCYVCNNGEYQDGTGEKNCKKCPVGNQCPNTTYSTSYGFNRGIISPTPCNSGHYQNEEGKASCKNCSEGLSSSTSGPQSSCTPCPVGQWTDGAGYKCRAIVGTIISTIHELSGAQQRSGSLGHGVYALVLGGGNGGSNPGSDYTSAMAGGSGAKLAVTFTVPYGSTYPYVIASGANGSQGASNHGYGAAGGGGGSWFKLNNTTTYVAGGGAGAGALSARTDGNWTYNPIMWAQGGSGGAVGSGGAGGDTYGETKCYHPDGGDGGASGNWAGGLFERKNDGGNGNGDTPGNGGRHDRKENRDYKSAGNDFGGRGGVFAYGLGNASGTGKVWYPCKKTAYESCSNPYQSITYYNAENGKASHGNSLPGNVASKMNCTSCARLYKIR